MVDIMLNSFNSIMLILFYGTLCTLTSAVHKVEIQMPKKLLLRATAGEHFVESEEPKIIITGGPQFSRHNCIPTWFKWTLGLGE